MNPIDLILPDGSAVYNRLFRTTDPAYLTQDVLAVRLPNGRMIDAGWFPEHDPAGSYLITISGREGSLINELPAPDADTVKKYVELLASVYSEEAINVAASGAVQDARFEVAA